MRSLDFTDRLSYATGRGRGAGVLISWHPNGLIDEELIQLSQDLDIPGTATPNGRGVDSSEKLE